MRLTCSFCLLLLAMPVMHAQPVKTKVRQDACETLCAELFASIRSEPDKMVMRLEEALVINEGCAGDIVTAAIDAVNSEPAMVRKIVDTAMDMAPRRANTITAAVRNYHTPEVAIAIPAAAAPQASEEIRRAELPEFVRPKPAAGEEVRRAELPLASQSMPIIEVRRAEAPAAAVPLAEPTTLQQPMPDHGLMNVPKAKPLKTKTRR